MISNSNWTEWSTIQGVIGRVISKSDLKLRIETTNYDLKLRIVIARVISKSDEREA